MLYLIVQRAKLIKYLNKVVHFILKYTVIHIFLLKHLAEWIFMLNFAPSKKKHLCPIKVIRKM